jgi:hypothetical protein
MGAAGLFTKPDLVTLGRAASLAEALTEDFFGLTHGEWQRNPYGVFTRKETLSTLHEINVFASVIRYPAGREARQRRDHRYGIVLQDPNILLALLRSTEHDLWALGLFILTHELVHILRFQRFGVDFFATVADRDREERVVHGVTREIFSGVTNMAHILSLYRDYDDSFHHNPQTR